MQNLRNLYPISLKFCKHQAHPAKPIVSISKRDDEDSPPTSDDFELLVMLLLNREKQHI